MASIFPASAPVWASDTNMTSSPVPSETGNPTKVDAGAPYYQQGFVAGAPFVGPYANFMLNRMVAHLNYLRALDTDDHFLGQAYTWTAAHRFNGGAVRIGTGLSLETGINITYVNTSGTPTPRTTVKCIPIIPRPVGAAAGTGFLQANGEFIFGGTETLSIPIDFANGTDITGAIAYVDVISGTMTYKLWKSTFNTGSGVTTTTQLGVTDTSTGTGYQYLTVGSASGLPATVAPGTSYWLELTGHGADLLKRVEVDVSEAGFYGVV